MNNPDTGYANPGIRFSQPVRHSAGEWFGESYARSAPGVEKALFKRYDMGMLASENAGVGTASAGKDTFPSPSSVMRRSMVLPGWGQVTNRQIWKVPIIYGMLAGLTYYTYLMDQNYRDYRAAYYNSFPDQTDERFGPTPPYIDPGTNPESLRFNRNVYRNRRDLTVIGVLLAYGLNLVDAYVFAHMRDFDVSDDLSARIHLSPFNGHARSMDTGFIHSYPSLTGLPVSGISDAAIVTLQLNFR